MRLPKILILTISIIATLSGLINFRQGLVAGISTNSPKSIFDYFSAKDYQEYLKELDKAKKELASTSEETSGIVYGPNGQIISVQGILPEALAESINDIYNPPPTPVNKS